MLSWLSSIKYTASQERFFSCNLFLWRRAGKSFVETGGTEIVLEQLGLLITERNRCLMFP